MTKNDDTGWYMVSISLYCLVLGGTGSAKGLYACIYLRRWRFGRVTPMPDRHIHRQQNIGLVYSKKLKLSHAKRSTFSSRKVIINKMIFWFVLNVLCKKEGVRFSKITCRNRTGLTRRTFYHFVVIVGKTACSNRFKPRGKYLLLRWDPLRGQECQASSFLRASFSSCFSF